MPSPNPDVDALLEAAPLWPDVLTRLRAIVLDTPLVEEVKWRQPCYTHAGKNVAILGAFKGHAALAFFKGALLQDPARLLVAPGPNSRSSRQLRFRSVEQVDTFEPVIRAYLAEAIRVEDDGRSVPRPRPADLRLPTELQQRLDADADFRAAWHALTPGRRRGYVIQISGAKRAATRTARVEKHRERILAGKGLHDR